MNSTGRRLFFDKILFLGLHLSFNTKQRQKYRMANYAPPEWDFILSAAQKNDANRIRALIHSGVPQNHSNAVGQTALHVAALWGNVEAVTELLRGGADCMPRNRLTGATPLHLVVTVGKSKAPVDRRKAVIQILIDHGANPMVTDSHGRTPADYCEEEELVSLLNPPSPYVSAIRERSIEKLQHLIQTQSKGLDTVVARENHTPLSLAVSELIEVLDKDETSREEAESLAEIIRVLLLAIEKVTGAVSVEREPDDDPLFLLLSLLQRLMKEDEDHEWCTTLVQNIVQYKGWSTPPLDKWDIMQRAARRNERSFLRFCIESLGWDPNTAGRQGMTALQFAARSGKSETLVSPRHLTIKFVISLSSVIPCGYFLIK